MIGMDFETAALVTGGKLNNKYIGSVTWGWYRDNKGDAVKNELKIGHKETATGAVDAAARVWNRMRIEGQGLIHLPLINESLDETLPEQKT